MSLAAWASREVPEGRVVGKVTVSCFQVRPLPSVTVMRVLFLPVTAQLLWAAYQVC